MATNQTQQKANNMNNQQSIKGSLTRATLTPLDDTYPRRRGMAPTAPARPSAGTPAADEIVAAVAPSGFRRTRPDTDDLPPRRSVPAPARSADVVAEDNQPRRTPASPWRPNGMTSRPSGIRRPKAAVRKT